MSLILVATLFYKVLILQGEIWCWSLLGLKELNEVKTSPDRTMMKRLIFDDLRSNDADGNDNVKKQKV